jgi:hypothetical protein
VFCEFILRVDKSVLRVSSFPHLRLLHRLLKINIVINRHDEANQFQQNPARNEDRFVIYN